MIDLGNKFLQLLGGHSDRLLETCLLVCASFAGNFIDGYLVVSPGVEQTDLRERNASADR